MGGGSRFAASSMASCKIIWLEALLAIGIFGFYSYHLTPEPSTLRIRCFPTFERSSLHVYSLKFTTRSTLRFLALTLTWAKTSG